MVWVHGLVRFKFIHHMPDPAITTPYMVLKHEVTPKLTPILKALGRKYSPVRSEFF